MNDTDFPTVPADSISRRSRTEIELGNFRRNLETLRENLGENCGFMVVVKADAYGHGAKEIAGVAEKTGAMSLGVANADEGVQLRWEGVSIPVVILSPSLEEEIPDILELRLTPAVADIGFLDRLSAAAARRRREISVHVEVDTGMGRSGIQPESLEAFLQGIRERPGVRLGGVFSHLAMGEAPDATFSGKQGETFSRLIDRIKSRGFKPGVVHFNNSAGIIRYPQFNFDMVRIGLAAYGIYPEPEMRNEIDLKPVMAFYSRIAQIRNMPVGSGISYWRTYVADHRLRVGILPIGYGDGFGFLLSNRGCVLVHGKRCPILGRVTMDMTMIDLENAPEASVGDRVTLIGCEGEERITAESVAELSETIPYDVVCSIGRRAPRVFRERGLERAVEPRLGRGLLPEDLKSVSQIDNIIDRCLRKRSLDEDLGDAVFHDVFRTLFGSGRDVRWRRNFSHELVFEDLSSEVEPDAAKREAFFSVYTRIEFTRLINQDYIRAACATSHEALARLFEDRNCVYRWLLDTAGFPLQPGDFRVINCSVDGVPLISDGATLTDCGVEEVFTGKILREKRGKEVAIRIDTQTLNPRAENYFPVYFAQPTRGMKVRFKGSAKGIGRISALPFFAGKEKYPEIKRIDDRELLVTLPDMEWIFPNSGLIFIWRSPGE